MNAELKGKIAAALAEKPDGVLEAVAAKCDASLAQVFACLPEDQVRLFEGSAFENLWATLTTWGEVLFIVHTADIVLECVGALPEGSSAHGYFNIHGDSPIGGHIKASNCAKIAVVDRPFHGKRSCSVQFLNGDGNAMFKVFVRRDKERQLLPEQLERFEALKSGAMFQSAA
ncbi:heme utilization cystosolic carrier protein HutX [Aestuariivirga sp.]|uniref:heme utilization cystosolic carrier protein HutX n=1 Tax=Aestuariivirga sp. TaxID=2650926 RepID=UPI0039E31EE6